ncbi:MAG: adenosylcobinamide-phosphate synthase CbiB [Desulfobacteraceae bacterium]|nr:adenosylcobinamide-phosphate synthase CbiB [Desulfobacteraceae bacterium]
MISAEPAILASAMLLDLALGDPRWLPHPVVLIGRLITTLDTTFDRIGAHQRAAGVALLVLTAGSAGAAAWLIIRGSLHLHPLAGFLASVIISYTCLATRSLHRESALVADALAAGNLVEARRCLAHIVGRDTAELDEGGIWRALVETVAENTTDGIVAPLFWLTATGPVGGMVYKAVSTLDSMVGYKSERYLRFGWASARMDDLLNFIPSRLTALLMILAAPLAGLSPTGALSIVLRDRLKHPSPNSGHPEAAAAGALGVRLGGPSTYKGIPSWKEYIGLPLEPLNEQAYRGMLKLMYLTTLLMAGACIAGAYALGGTLVPHL